MEYFINLTYDPFICSLSVSLILSIGLAFLWNRFRINSASYFAEKPAEMFIDSEYQNEQLNNKPQNRLIIWIIKYVRRREGTKDDSDHHLSVIPEPYKILGG